MILPDLTLILLLITTLLPKPTVTAVSSSYHIRTGTRSYADKEVDETGLGVFTVSKI